MPPEPNQASRPARPPEPSDPAELGESFGSRTATQWMESALRWARRASQEGEVPVGAVVLLSGRVVGVGWNRTESLGDPTAHAEILALRRAARTVGNYRIPGAVLVSTLEPCLMCFGACLEARVSEVLWGAADPARGATALWTDGAIAEYPVSALECRGGLEQEACASLLREYFAGRRRRDC